MSDQTSTLKPSASKSSIDIEIPTEENPINQENVTSRNSQRISYTFTRVKHALLKLCKSSLFYYISNNLVNSYFIIDVIIVFVTMYCCFAWALPMIFIGAKNIDECPVQKYIPIWLVTFGITGLLANAFEIVNKTWEMFIY